MHGVETLETDGSAEHAALGFESGSRVPASEVEDPCSLGLGASAHVMCLSLTRQDNLAAKHLVIQASYPGGPAYFGHVSWPCWEFTCRSRLGDHSMHSEGHRQRFSQSAEHPPGRQAGWSQSVGGCATSVP